MSQPASPSDDRLALERLSADLLPAFTTFLESLDSNGDAAFFHPHAFDAESARRIAAVSETGRDEYWLAMSGPEVVAYGMLRGWDEGYDVPSLGLAVAPLHRGRGFAREMMRHLHDRAKQRGADRIRLKVDRRNLSAIRLYESLGYRLDEHSPTELVGYLEHAGARTAPASAEPAPFIPVAIPDLSGNEEKYVVEAVRSSWISSSGAFLERFEAEFATACESRFALGVSNGTTALHLALAGMNVQQGDEVIVPSMTYIATANAIRYCGGEPVFVDVDPETWCITAEAVEAAITPRTRGVIVVHLLGQPADMDPIMRVASTHGLWVVEDTAEAPFATYKGRAVGSIGHAGTFSFYGNKLLTSGEGGAITFQEPIMERRYKMLRGQGMDPDRRYYFPIIGFNYRMTNVAAAILCGQMERRAAIMERRRRIWSRYVERLSTVPGIGLRRENDWSETSPWMFACLVDEKTFGTSRDHLARALHDRRIETRPMFVPLHSLPPYRQALVAARELPVTDGLGATGIMLPTYTGLADHDIDRICDAIAEVGAGRMGLTGRRAA
ncbi:MAG: GNAT family N-acetyltransferase [Planctomycetia bacterium]